MATKFSDLRPMIRVLLGDSDEQRQMFADCTLDSHIRLRILTDNNLDVQEVGKSTIFSKDLTAAQKALMVFKVARAIIAPIPDSFSYRNAVHSASRKGGSIQLIAYLDSQIEEVEGSGIQYDNEIMAIVNGALRFYSDYSNSLIVSQNTPSSNPSIP